MAVPVYSRTFAEYRSALDAASVWLSEYSPLKLFCISDLLRLESLQRMGFSDVAPWKGILWVEPQLEQWTQTLNSCVQNLAPSGRLAVVISQPLAKILPERLNYQDKPLGLQRSGLRQILTALRSNKFNIEEVQSLHTYQSILTNQSAAIIRRMNKFALADRLEFSAKQHYIQPWKGASRGTCALILATRK